MPVLLQIALGGALGACLRHFLSGQIARSLGPGFPWGTLAVNVVGSFAMGLAAVLLLRRPELGLQAHAPFLITGILGGFTTFSAFSLETYSLIERGRPALAVAYVGGSVLLGVAAFAAALAIIRPEPGA